MDIFSDFGTDFAEEGIVNQFFYDSMLVRLREAIFFLVLPESLRIKKTLSKALLNGLLS